MLSYSSTLYTLRSAPFAAWPQAAIAEYLGSCSRHGVAVPAGLHLLAVDVALLRGHPHQVTRLLLLLLLLLWLYIPALAERL